MATEQDHPDISPMVHPPIVALMFIVTAPFYMMTMTRLVIEREEAYLEKRFRVLYTDYISRVRRWL